MKKNEVHTPSVIKGDFNCMSFYVIHTSTGRKTFSKKTGWIPVKVLCPPWIWTNEQVLMTINLVNVINGYKRGNFPVSLHCILRLKFNCSLGWRTLLAVWPPFWCFTVWGVVKKNISDFGNTSKIKHLLRDVAWQPPQQTEELLLLLKRAVWQKMTRVTCSTVCGQRPCCLENFAASSRSHALSAAFHPLDHNISEGLHAVSGILEPHPYASSDLLPPLCTVAWVSRRVVRGVDSLYGRRGCTFFALQLFSFISWSHPIADTSDAKELKAFVCGRQRFSVCQCKGKDKETERKSES